LTLPNCSFHVGVVGDGTTRQSIACRHDKAIHRLQAPWESRAFDGTREDDALCQTVVLFLLPQERLMTTPPPTGRRSSRARGRPHVEPTISTQHNKPEVKNWLRCGLNLG
jgi:hypothetical protein